MEALEEREEEEEEEGNNLGRGQANVIIAGNRCNWQFERKLLANTWNGERYRKRVRGQAV